MLFNSKVKDIPARSTWLVCGNLKYLVLTNYDVNYLCKVIKLPQVAILEDLISALAGQYGASATTTVKKQWG